MRWKRERFNGRRAPRLWRRRRPHRYGSNDEENRLAPRKEGERETVIGLERLNEEKRRDGICATDLCAYLYLYLYLEGTNLRVCWKCGSVRQRAYSRWGLSRGPNRPRTRPSEIPNDHRKYSIVESQGVWFCCIAGRKRTEDIIF